VFAIAGCPIFKLRPPGGGKADPLKVERALEVEVTLKPSANLWPFARYHYFAVD
jgi:hypothetical protein